MVKPDRVTNDRSQEVAEELVRVMRGIRGYGREKGGAIAAPQLGTPSRLIAYEDPPGAVAELSGEEKELEGRQEAFGPKVIFNPRTQRVSQETSVLWERSTSVPGYRALVERPTSVKVTGLDPFGREVDYVATGWEARLAQQATDVLDGILITDRCITQSLRHLDAQDDPLPPDCPPLGVSGSSSEQPSGAQLEEAAEKGGSRGLFGGFSLPGLSKPKALLIGSLLLRLPSKEVAPEDVGSQQVTGAIKELREAWESGEHPLGVAAPQFGHRLRIIVVGEKQEQVDSLSARNRVMQEHSSFGPLVLINPVVKPRPKSQEAFFFERSASVPGYEAVVGRSLEIDVEGLTERGERVSLTARGWKARIIQHTVDMLDGKLFVDRMERRSFKRETVKDELADDVPYGVRAPRPAAAAKPRPSKRAPASKRSGGRDERQRAGGRRDRAARP